MTQEEIEKMADRIAEMCGQCYEEGESDADCKEAAMYMANWMSMNHKKVFIVCYKHINEDDGKEYLVLEKAFFSWEEAEKYSEKWNKSSDNDYRDILYMRVGEDSLECSIQIGDK